MLIIFSFPVNKFNGEELDSAIDEGVNYFFTNNFSVSGLMSLHFIETLSPDEELRNFIINKSYEFDDYYLPFIREVRNETFSLSEVSNETLNVLYNDFFIPIFLCENVNVTRTFIEKINNLQDNDSIKGDYHNTHALLFLLLLRDRNCFDKNELDDLIKDRVVQIREQSYISQDLFAERIALIQYAGFSVPEDNVAFLIKNQNLDGGWGWHVDNESNPHTSGLALLSLVQYKNSLE